MNTTQNLARNVQRVNVDRYRKLNLSDWLSFVPQPLNYSWDERKTHAFVQAKRVRFQTLFTICFKIAYVCVWKYVNLYERTIY